MTQDDERPNPAAPEQDPPPSGHGRPEAGDAGLDRTNAPKQSGPHRRAEQPTFPEQVLGVVGWPDPVLDQLGHDPRSGYVERFWLPILGPSCLLLIRRLAAELERHPDGFEIESARWARELGIGMKGGQHGPFWRAVERACRFGAARRNGPRLALRRRLPPLSTRQVQRLPASLRLEHAEWVDARLDRPTRPTVTRWTPRIEPTTAPEHEAIPGPRREDEVEFDDAA